MEVLLWAYLGGIAGAVLMDIAEGLAGRAGITSGVSVALVGRWFLGLRRGQWRHRDIRAPAAQPGEVAAGWVFHLCIGGGAVALFYPLSFWLGGLALPDNHLWGGLLFGLATCLLPWLVLLPAFGWGLGGRRGPAGSNALLASVLSHIPYGLGVGAVMTAGLG